MAATFDLSKVRIRTRICFLADSMWCTCFCTHKYIPAIAAYSRLQTPLTLRWRKYTYPLSVIVRAIGVSKCSRMPFFDGTYDRSGRYTDGKIKKKMFVCTCTYVYVRFCSCSSYMHITRKNIHLVMLVLSDTTAERIRWDYSKRCFSRVPSFLTPLTNIGTNISCGSLVQVLNNFYQKQALCTA